jgi:hypothetical protein
MFRAGRVSVGVRALGFLTRCTQRSGAVFRCVSSGEVSVGGFDAVYAAFRRSVSQCFLW